MNEVKYNGVIYRVGDQVIRVSRSYQNALIGNKYTIKEIQGSTFGSVGIRLFDSDDCFYGMLKWYLFCNINWLGGQNG